MKKNEWIAVLAVVIVVAVLASLITSNLTGSVTGNALFNSKRGTRASSCDADLQCETKSMIADSASRIGSVVIDGKTISTKGGSTSALVLTSDVKKVIVDGSLSATYLSGGGNDSYACLDGDGKLYRGSLTGCN